MVGIVTESESLCLNVLYNIYHQNLTLLYNLNLYFFVLRIGHISIKKSISPRVFQVLTFLIVSLSLNISSVNLSS